MADLHDVLPARYSLDTVGVISTLNVDPVMVGTGQLVNKPLVDLAFPISVLLLLWPVLLVVAISRRNRDQTEFSGTRLLRTEKGWLKQASIPNEQI